MGIVPSSFSRIIFARVSSWNVCIQSGVVLARLRPTQRRVREGPTDTHGTLARTPAHKRPRARSRARACMLARAQARARMHASQIYAHIHVPKHTRVRAHTYARERTLARAQARVHMHASCTRWYTHRRTRMHAPKHTRVWAHTYAREHTYEPIDAIKRATHGHTHARSMRSQHALAGTRTGAHACTARTRTHLQAYKCIRHARRHARRRARTQAGRQARTHARTPARKHARTHKWPPSLPTPVPPLSGGAGLREVYAGCACACAGRACAQGVRAQGRARAVRKRRCTWSSRGVCSREVSCASCCGLGAPYASSPRLLGFLAARRAESHLPGFGRTWEGGAGGVWDGVFAGFRWCAHRG